MRDTRLYVSETDRLEPDFIRLKIKSGMPLLEDEQRVMDRAKARIEESLDRMRTRERARLPEVGSVESQVTDVVRSMAQTLEAGGVVRQAMVRGWHSALLGIVGEIVADRRMPVGGDRYRAFGRDDWKHPPRIQAETW